MVKIVVAEGDERATTFEVEESFEQVWTWLTLPGHFLKVTGMGGEPVIVNKARIVLVERGEEGNAGTSWPR